MRKWDLEVDVNGGGISDGSRQLAQPAAPKLASEYEYIDAHLYMPPTSFPVYAGHRCPREGSKDDVDKKGDAKRLQKASRGWLEFFDMMCRWWVWSLDKGSS